MEQRKPGINTLPRFLYLNSYAFLLLALGVGIVFLPLYDVGGWWLAVPQAIVVLICWKGAYSILHSWADKKRKYQVLMERNLQGLRPDTFTDFMQAPCGRLLSRLVLRDLGLENEWPRLLALREPLLKRFRTACRPTKTVLYINKDYKP